MLKALFFSKAMLWLLFWINAAGTVYGYMWYANQLKHTYETMDLWLLPFVPDSPTASLFFTVSLLFMIAERSNGAHWLNGAVWRGVRGFIDAFAVITSLKYGIWAVAMIVAGASQGDVIVWQEWMLIGSHLGMAAQVIVYAGWLRYGRIAIAAVAVWTLVNDYLDYHRGIFPWLPSVLHDDLHIIEWFTIGLSLACVAAAWALHRAYRHRKA